MEDIKRIDLNEFKEKGFLQEANRLFFHPLGLALEVIVDENGYVTHLGGIWDYRDDPEGMFFGKKAISKEKIKHVNDLKISKIQNRKRNNYGIIVSHLGVQQPQKEGE